MTIVRGVLSRWHGYHPDQHTEVVEQYNKLDEERRRARQEAQENARTVSITVVVCIILLLRILPQYRDSAVRHW
jgi:Pre-mRNA splicing Prp18-interacting factor